MKPTSRSTTLPSLFLAAAVLAAAACRAPQARSEEVAAPSEPRATPRSAPSAGVEPSAPAAPGVSVEQGVAVEPSVAVELGAPVAPGAAAAPGAGVEPGASVGPAAAQSPETIVLALVNDRPLTLAEAIATFLSSHMGHGVLVRGEPAVRELAGRLVERDLFLAEAAVLGVPEEAQVLEIVDAFHKELAADEFWKREVKDKARISDEEVEAFYAKTDVALQLTLIESAERTSAEALRARVEAGEDMAALARRESIHPSRTFDGVLSYVRRGELQGALEEAAFALETPASLTPVVATEKGFAFARLDGRAINPDRPPRETALPQIRGILEERTTKRLANEVEERADAAAEVWIDDEQLSSTSVLDGPDAGIVIARAAGDSLTLQDVRDALRLDLLRTAAPETAGDAARQLVRQWTRREALKRAGVDAGLLADAGIVAKTNAFRRDVVFKILCERFVWQDLEPSEAELQAFYEEHKATDFTQPAEVRLAYILVASEEDAAAVLQRLAAGEEFERVAQEVSKDPTSAIHGGRIGWVKPGEVLPAVEERAFALEVGVVDGPVVTDEGCFILKVMGRKEEQLVAYTYARATALKRLVKERQNAAYAKWALALRERASVRLNEAGVAAAVAWCEQEALAKEAEKAAKAPSSHGAEILPPGAPPPADATHGGKP